MCLKHCCMYGKQCRPWSDAAFPIHSVYIFMKTRLFKYIENFTTKKWNFSDKNWYFSYFCSKTYCEYSLELPQQINVIFFFQKRGSNIHAKETIIRQISTVLHKNMMWVLIRSPSARYPQCMFLQRNKLLPGYPSYLQLYTPVETVLTLVMVNKLRCHTHF